MASGGRLTFKLEGNLSEAIEAGSKAKYEVSIKAGPTSIPAKSGTIDLCEMLPQGCPVGKGPAILEKGFTIPNAAPEGEFIIKVTATNQDDKQVTCVEAEVSI